LVTKCIDIIYSLIRSIWHVTLINGKKKVIQIGSKSNPQNMIANNVTG
jgi:hypothetical protein